MFGHIPELIIILAIGLIVFGPEKLPEMAASTGKMIRELREMMTTALNPQDTEVPEDFSSYYYESLTRSGEETPGEVGVGPDTGSASFSDSTPEAEENPDELAVLEPVNANPLEGETGREEASRDKPAHRVDERTRDG